MWSANKIGADAASKIQCGAGILVKNFQVSAPTEPADEDIVCETTGAYHLTCIPDVYDLFEDINNAPMNTKEGKRIKGWNCGLTVTSLTATEDSLKLSLGAADGTETTGIKPRKQFTSTDFKKIYWIGDMIDENKLFVVAMDDTVSTGGIDFSAEEDGKGGFALTLTPHSSLATPNVVPMAFYILTKQEA